MFLAKEPNLSSALEVSDVYDLYVDGALYLKNEGRLDDSIALLSALESRSLPTESSDDRPASALLVRSGIELLRGGYGRRNDKHRTRAGAPSLIGWTIWLDGTG